MICRRGQVRDKKKKVSKLPKEQYKEKHLIL